MKALRINAIRLDYLMPIFIFAGSLIIYLLTLSPTVGLEDSGELITAVSSLGIAHPSGYPVYVVLGKLFTLLIPLGSIAWRVNLFSAFCAALTAGLFSLLLFEILNAFSGNSSMSHDKNARRTSAVPLMTAAVISLALASSAVFWSQAVIAEVYTLNAFFVVLTIFLLWRYERRRRALTLFAFALVYGISVNNHQLMLLLAPVYFLFLLLAEYTSFKTRPRGYLRRYCIASLLFLLGLSFYFFVYWRAGQDPLLNWERPDTLVRLWQHFTRQSYRDFSPHLWGDLLQLKKIIYVHFFFSDLIRQLTLIGALFASIGFLTAWFRNRSFFLLSFGVFLMNSLAVIFLRKLGYSYEGEQVYRPYYIPAYLIAFLWAGIGISHLWHLLSARISASSLRTRFLPLLISVFLLLTLPVSLILQNYYANDKHDFWLVHDWGVSLLQSLAPDAVLLLYNEQPSADSQIFAITYLTLVEQVRPDVAIVDIGYISSRFYHLKGPDLEEVFNLPYRPSRARFLNRVWDIARAAERPVYTAYPVGSPLNGDLIGRSNGLAFRIFPNIETARLVQIAPASLSLRNLDDARLNESAYGRDFLLDILYARAAYLLEQGRFTASESVFIDAFNLDQTPLSANTYDYMAYRARWLQ